MCQSECTTIHLLLVRMQVCDVGCQIYSNVRIPVPAFFRSVVDLRVQGMHGRCFTRFRVRMCRPMEQSSSGLLFICISNSLPST